MSGEAILPIRINEDNFRDDSFVVDPAEPNKSKAGFEWTSSTIYYVIKGKKYIPYLDLPSEVCFPLTYKYGMNNKDFSPAKRQGIQLAYPLTSRNNIDNPTKEEKFVYNVFEALRKVGLEALNREKKRQHIAIVKDWNPKDVSKSLKPIFSKPKENPEGKQDKVYLSLLTNGKGDDMKFVGLLTDEESNELSIDNYTVTYIPGSTGGNTSMYKMTPCVKITGLYWGTHGSTDYKCSVSMKVARLVIEEVNNNYLPPRDFFDSKVSNFKKFDTTSDDDKEDEFPQNEKNIKKLTQLQDSDSEDNEEDKTKSVKKNKKIVEDNEEEDFEEDVPKHKKIKNQKKFLNTKRVKNKSKKFLKKIKK